VLHAIVKTLLEFTQFLFRILSQAFVLVFYAAAIDFAGVCFASCNLLPDGKLS
jgi:hypothetical protein